MSTEVLIDAPGFSIVNDDGRIGYEFDSIIHARGYIMGCVGVLGYQVEDSIMDSDMWERGRLSLVPPPFDPSTMWPGPVMD